jgi:hypothetical protein
MTFKVGHPIPPVPRTLQQAFGPHTSSYITPSEDNRRKDRITVIGCLLAIAALVAILWLT